MKTKYKKCKVISLGTNHPNFSLFEIRKNLYIVSEDEIKEGDYVIIGKRIVQAKLNGGCLGYDSFDRVAFLYFRNNKKIIASNDKTLDVPRLSKKFTSYFINECSKGNFIKEILVGYHPEVHQCSCPCHKPGVRMIHCRPCCYPSPERLKISNELISIKLIEYSYNDEEVEELLHEC